MLNYDTWQKVQAKVEPLRKQVMEAILKDDNSNLERKYHLLKLYRHGYKNIRSINSKLAFKAKFDEYNINFIKILKEANILNVLNEIYTKNEVKKYWSVLNEQ